MIKGITNFHNNSEGGKTHCFQSITLPLQRDRKLLIMDILNEIEEAEEEILLEELDWSKVGNDPKEIQVALAAQSETLNTEIIDFLLQWEEDENVGKTLPDSKRVRDTFEVLDALSQVDNDLEGVNLWLSEQIERLFQV